MLLKRAKEVADECNKKVVSVEVIQSEGIDFKAFYDASYKLKERDFIVAPMCGDKPIGFAKGVSYIAKWKNISREDREKLDGVIIADSDFRKDSVAIIHFKQM